METNYRTRDDIEADIARRQKKLIPLNIVVAMLALVAALTIMFAPLLTIDLGKSGDVVAEILQESSDGDSQSDESDSDDILNNITEVLNFKLSLTTYSMLRFSFSSDPVEYLSGKIADILSEVTDSLITEVMIPTIVDSLNESTNIDITTEEVENVLSKVEALETARTDAEVDNAIEDLFAELQSLIGEDVLSEESYDDFYETLREIYDETVANTEDKTFSIEAMISVYASELLGDEDEIFTSYDELVYSVLNSYLGDTEETIEYVVTGVTALALVMTFFAAVWGILFLFALLRIFARNKRFSMWYVKMFGFWPCLLFSLIPIAIPAALGSLLGESGTIISAIFGMISSMTWISGACYILLWLVSIFWAFPIKRRIRADIKALEKTQY